MRELRWRKKAKNLKILTSVWDGSGGCYRKLPVEERRTEDDSAVGISMDFLPLIRIPPFNKQNDTGKRYFCVMELFRTVTKGLNYLL